MALLSVICIIGGAGNVPVHAQTINVQTASVGSANMKNAQLVDQVYFSVDGNDIVFSDKPRELSTFSQSNNVMSGTIKYYYNGLDSKKRPQYSVVATILSSNLTIKSSILKTKAEGVSSWHSNDVKNYTGKTAVNKRSYVYTKNPPKNPYCEVKLYVTDSENFQTYIGYTKLTNAIS